MRLPIYQIDAFADQPFQGNAAAVMPLHRWLPDEILQALAMENNLSETAFFVPSDGVYHIRWFTPEFEMDLCGHATLAAAFTILTELDPDSAKVDFTSMSGPLSVARDGDRFRLDFPARPPRPIPVPEGLSEALGAPVLEAGQSRDLLAVIESESVVSALKPDFAALARFADVGVIATARGESADCVSRCFFPNEGVPEDPVTGSSHCTVVPFWAERLGRTTLHARQLSRRGGELFCELKGDRVLISGRAVKVMQGEFLLPD